jgi:hypothetical protein
MTVDSLGRWLVRRVPAAAALLAALVTLLAARPAAAQTRYKVRVDSAPPGATVYVGRKESGAVGVTPWSGALTSGNHTLILEMEGYQPATRSVKVARTRKVQDFFVPLVKVADPPRIDVRADADKNLFGATIYLDGQPQGTAPALLTTTVGRHLVRIEKEGFVAFEQWIEVKDNEKVTLNPFLREARSKLGTIIVEADVPDAEVLLDGNRIGTTPAVIPDVVEGLHVVEVRKEPALPWKQTVQVRVGEQTKVRAELKATLGGQGGSIRVLSNVQGAHVFLDGTDMGAVPVDIKDVKPGEHVIEVKAPKYQTREERVTVNAGSATVLKLDLHPESKSEAVIKVVSPVPGADVYIDGALAGKVPIEQEVGAGEHYVIVKLDGYKTFEHKLRIERGQVQTVSAELRAVGRLRVLSDPPGATVLINGIPQDERTPVELNEVEVGETVVRIEMAGMMPQERSLPIIGGKTEVLSFRLEIQGKSELELLDEQRGLSSFGARTLPRGRSTIDFGIGYPYFGDVRVNVGAGHAGNFGLDAGVGVRTFFARSELGLGVRLMLVDADPFTLGAFSDIWWGSKLLDNSKRNGMTFNAGAMASLTALTQVTVTGRLYFNTWSDRHCPSIDRSGDFEPQSDPISACVNYRDFVIRGTNPDAMSVQRMERVTGLSGEGMFGRESGARLMASAIAEIAVRQHWNLWFMLEGAPFQTERALFTNDFAQPMFKSDFNTYFRMGLTHKF